MSAGIYKITNKLNGHCYIGQSKNISERWEYHKAKSHWNKDNALYSAFLKYGIENFSFEIIELTSDDKKTLNEREKYWIKYYHSYGEHEGYNLTKGGDGYSIRYSLISEEDIINIRKKKMQYYSPKEVFLLYQHKISWGTFDKIWNGKMHSEIMNEIYQDKEKLKFIERVLKQRMNLSKSGLSVDIILDIRSRRIKGQQRKDVMKLYPEIAEGTFDGIWYNKYYKEIIPNGNQEYINLLRGKHENG